MFYEGQKIVCVDTNWVLSGIPEYRYPILNEVYTIKRIIKADQMDERDEISFRLFEFQSYGTFLYWHFKPVETPDTTAQVEELKKLLLSTPQNLTEEV